MRTGCVLLGWLWLAAAPALAGDHFARPPGTSGFRIIGFGYGPGYHARTCCPGCGPACGASGYAAPLGGAPWISCPGMPAAPPPSLSAPPPPTPAAAPAATAPSAAWRRGLGQPLRIR